MVPVLVRWRVRRVPEEDGAETRTLRIAPGHEPRAERRATRLHKELRKAQPLARELIYPRSGHANPGTSASLKDSPCTGAMLMLTTRERRPAIRTIRG
jgi:hypothetical protein